MRKIFVLLQKVKYINTMMNVNCILYFVILFFFFTSKLYTQDLKKYNFDIVTFEAKVGSYEVFEDLNEGNPVEENEQVEKVFKGELLLNLSINGSVYPFKFNFQGKGKSQLTKFECGGNKEFILNGTNSNPLTLDSMSPIPYIDDLNLLPFQNSNQAIEAFKSNNSEETAWIIWLLKTKELSERSLITENYVREKKTEKPESKWDYEGRITGAKITPKVMDSFLTTAILSIDTYYGILPFTIELRDGLEWGLFRKFRGTVDLSSCIEMYLKFNVINTNYIIDSDRDPFQQLFEFSK